MNDTTLDVFTVPLPPGSRATRFYPEPNLADAYAVRLPAGATHDPEVLARFMFAQQAPWVARLLWLRDTLVAAVGLKTTRQLQAASGSAPVPRVAFFRIYAQDAHEILLGEDDRHLDFRLTVRCEALAGTTGATQLIVSTVVKCHNALGRFYIAVIAPWHRLLVRSALRRAARAGWPTQENRP